MNLFKKKQSKVFPNPAFQLGKLRSKNLILECLLYSDTYFEDLSAILTHSNRNMRKMLVENYRLIKMMT